MSEAIDEFLVDFYKTKNNEDISVDKIQEIKKAYGSDTDSLITDLYTKYDDGNIDKEKITTIKSTYKLTPEKKEKTPPVDYNKKQKNFDKVYETKLAEINKKDWDDDKKKLYSDKLKSIYNKKTKEYSTKKGIDEYTDKMFEVTHAVPTEEQKSQWYADALAGGKEIEITQEGSFGATDYKEDIVFPYEEFLGQAEEQLKNSKKPYGKGELKQQAMDLYVANRQQNWKNNQAGKILEEFETEHGVDRIDTLKDIFSGDFSALDGFESVKVLRNLYDAQDGIEYTKEDKELLEKDPWAFYTAQANKYINGSKQEREYWTNRQVLNHKLKTKNKELEIAYRDKVSDLTSRGEQIKSDTEQIEKYTKRLEEKDPTFTQEEYKEYQTLFNKLKVDQDAYNADLEELNSQPVPSNDVETIEKLTLKTFDNLQMVSNNVASSVISIGAGVGTVLHELSLPEVLEWGGIDIKSEEGLNEIFGEEDSFMKDYFAANADVTATFGEAIADAHELGSSVKDQNAPITSITDIEWGTEGSLADFGMWAMDLASGQLVNTALTIALPPAGLAIMATSAAGGKMHEMNQEMEGVKYTAEELASLAEQGITPDSEYKVEPIEYNAAQYFGTAAMYGGIEYATEKISLGILKKSLGLTKGLGKNVKKAFDLTDPNLTLKNLTNAQSWKKFGYDFGKDSFKEAGAEGAVTLVNNFADIHLLGKKDVGYLDGMTEAMAAGFFMGNMFQAPAIVSQVSKSFSSEGEIAKAQKNHAQLLKLSEQRDKILKTKGAVPAVKELQKQINQLLDAQMTEMSKVRNRTIDMTAIDRQGMIDISNRQHKLRAEIDAINEDPDLAPETKEDIINDQANELAKEEAKRERLIANAQWNADKKRASDLARDTRIQNNTLDQVTTVVAETNQDALDQGLQHIDNLDLTDQQKNAAKAQLKEQFGEVDKLSKGDGTIHGMAWGDNIEIETQEDGKMVKETINIPMTFAMDKGNLAVQSHELGHQTLFKSFMKNNADAVGLVDDLEAYVQKNYKKAYEQFNKVRGAYKTEGLTKEGMAEEQLAHLSDFMRQNNLKGDRTLYNKLFGRFQKVNDGQNQIETGKDVFDMLNSFNQSFEKGKWEGLAKSVIKGEAAVKRKKQEARDVKSKEQGQKLQTDLKAPKAKMSKFVEGETKSERSKRQNKRNVDVGKIYKADAAGKTNEQWRDFLDSPKGKSVMGDMIQQYYPDMIASAIKRKADSPMDAASEAIIPLMKHIEAFDPSQNKDLAGYVGGYLGLKVGTGVKKAAKKAPTISMEKEGVRQVAEKQAVKEETKEKAPERKGIKLAERLGDAAKKISEKVKKMKPVLEGKTYKTLKDLAPADTQRMFGIKPKPGNLTKQDVKNAQQFINKNADILLAMLPEGTTVGGKATGVQKVLLEPFYTKGRRVKAAKTGSKAGLATQNKKPNIKISEFKEVFGITPTGQPNVIDRNTSARIKALVDQTGKLITNQAIREVTPDAPKEIAEGKSRIMYSKSLDSRNLTQKEFKELYGDIVSFHVGDNVSDTETAETLAEAFQIKEKYRNIPLDEIVQLVAKNNEIKKGFAYEQVVYDNVKKAIKKGRIKGWTISEGPGETKIIDEKGNKISQPDFMAEIFDQRFNVELKLNNARYSSLSPTIDALTYEGKLSVSDSFPFKKQFEQMMKDQKEAYKEYVTRANELGYELFGNDFVPMDKFGDVLPMEVIEQMKLWEVQKLTTISKKFNQDVISALYELKGDGTAYIQIQDLGLFSLINLKDPSLTNPLAFDVNPLMGDVEVKLVLSKNSAASGGNRYKNKKLITNEKGKKVLKRKDGTLSKGWAKVNPRFIPSMPKKPDGKKLDKQKYNMDTVESIENWIKNDPAFTILETQKKNKVPASNKKILADSKVMPSKKSKSLDNKEIIREMNIMDKALNIARDPNAPVKKIRVFDFDDTLARTKSKVRYTMPDGKSGVMSAADFAKRGTELMEQGAEFDFSDFNKVVDGKKGPLFKVAEAIAGKRGTSDMFVLTARSAEAAPAIKEFLDALGLNIPIENITGLGDSSPLAKSGWMVGKAAEGYNDFYFADDHIANVEAVKEGMSKLDVKSKTQLAKQNNLPTTKFSKSLNWKTDEAGNINSSFKIKDKNYTASLVPKDETGQDYYYEFELETPTGSTQAVTGTGDAVAVFRTVYNGLLDAVKQNTNIRQVEFSARKGEASRIKLYTSLMNKLGKDLGWETDIWETTSILDEDGGHFDFEISKPSQKQSKPVQKVLDVIDVKSETQQAKVKFSKNIDQTFNDIIEEKTGIGSEKEYSAAKAKTVGSSKGKFKFWIAPSAEDFVGLLYTMLGKGKLGDTQMAWFKKHLLDPYGRAMENISREQTRLSNDFKALKKALVKSGTLPKNLNKKAVGNWTYQDVSRIVAWNKQGLEIPGLSKADLKEILDFANENPGINEFADQLIAINKGDGYIQPGKDWYAGTITTDLLQGLREGKRAKYLQEWQANADLIFSEKNLNKLEAAFGTKYREAMEDMLRRMRTGKNRTSTGNRLENRLLDYINNSVGTVMFLNMRSGVLQLLSAANFLNWKSNNPLKAGMAFANQKQYWSDFMRLMNSDFLVDRRNGLKINVSESEIADAARDSNNKARSVISYLLKKGFAVTQIMDSFAIASGGATFYRNRIKELMKKNPDMTKAEAEAQAYQEFRELAEESQQSSRPDRISAQQASNLGRVILAFANTPMQYNRIMKKAFLDLKNGRGDWKSNISKMLYYGAIQNAMFVGMQQALFAMMFNDEEEPDDEKKKKYMKMANSMGDNILRGLGIWGTSASTLIALVRKTIEEAQKEGYPGPDFDNAAFELLNLSPPIDIKMSKLRQAGSNWKYEGWKHDEAKWSMHDPAYKSAAYVISSLTNLPLDRLYRKLDNVQSALDSDNETWKRIAHILGWADWELETAKERAERVKDEKARKKDIKKEKVKQAQVEKVKQMTPEEKKKHEEEKKRKKYKDLNKAEQVHKLDSLGLTKKEIRALKYEKDRVEKLLELMENED